jgi:trehalose 6-phosphate synthase/phosphatase
VDLLEEHFYPLLKDGGHENLWLAAESGYLYRTGSSNGGEWRKLINLSTKIWFNSVKKIMEMYTENVDGSVVEERESTLVWNHKNAEEEHGNMVVGELYSQIKSLLGNSPVEIIQGKGYLEVKPSKLKKQKLLKTLLSKIAQQTKIDYLLYLGADTGNEMAYNFLLSKRSE